MAFFDPDNRTRTMRHRKVYAAYEIAHTAVDFSAAILFLVGSILFFYKPLENLAIWCFVVGSACFAMKPTIRIVREFHYLAIGDFTDLEKAARAG
ncbi:YrhK family protein [Afifella pfennigii]|uniref:YrhK family protein n=1 Tax=Afifella pfennigii TaxID=209897 RepID=UPI00047E534A|nr:YrhK family protein [Afifella pfennigii]